MNVISVLLAFESLELRIGVRLMIEECEDLDVVGEAVNALEVMEIVTTARPDIVLMDAELPHVTGIEATRILHDRRFPGAVIIVSDHVGHMEDALRSGATGYLLKNCPADEMLGAIRQASTGDLVFGGSVIKTSEGMEIALRYMTAWERPEVATTSARHGREDDTDGLPNTPSGSIEARTESPSPPTSPPTSIFMGDVDLLISPPLDTAWVLGLYQWLQANADVNEVSASRDRDTVVRVTFPHPIPIPQILAELPDIAEVIEEQYPEDSETSPSSRRELRFDTLRRRPTRYRLALKRK